MNAKKRSRNSDLTCLLGGRYVAHILSELFRHFQIFAITMTGVGWGHSYCMVMMSKWVDDDIAWWWLWWWSIYCIVFLISHFLAANAMHWLSPLFRRPFLVEEKVSYFPFVEKHFLFLAQALNCWIPAEKGEFSILYLWIVSIAFCVCLCETLFEKKLQLVSVYMRVSLV